MSKCIIIIVNYYYLLLLLFCVTFLTFRFWLICQNLNAATQLFLLEIYVKIYYSTIFTCDNFKCVKYGTKEGLNHQMIIS